MFDRRLPAVVPMNHRYLAQHDGSEMAAGRGMGADKASEKDLLAGIEENERRDGARPQAKQMTPYMHMTFHPLERRLDTAIFRALFASSVRQARQFVVHGSVTVNGKKMIYPGYQLNPGDMFSVDPERVMFATGAHKHKASHSDSRRAVLEMGSDVFRKRNDNMRRLEKHLNKSGEEGATEASSEDAAAEPVETVKIAKTAKATEPEPAAVEKMDHSKARIELRKLVSKTRNLLDDAKKDLSAAKLQQLRAFNRKVRTIMSALRNETEADFDDTVDGLETSLEKILGGVPEEFLPKGAAKVEATTPEQSATSKPASSNPQTQTKDFKDEYKARKDAERLAEALELVKQNPIDAAKPYATPWQPRDFMSAFAFIPRYLEVNQNICSAVYLRHPVARPGLAEIPTPFSTETMTLGFNWYLRRR